MERHLEQSARHAVTGASGFLGGHLCNRLASKGISVRCLVRNKSSTANLDGFGVDVRRGDLFDLDFLCDSLSGVDVLYHCAAMVSDWGTVKEITASNVDLTARLLKASEMAGLKHFVHVSTTDVYGNTGARAIEETHPLSPEFSNWYAHTKRLAEELVKKTAVDFTIVRPATIYGPQSVSIVGEIANAIVRKQMITIGGGRSIAGLTSVGNVVDALELVALNSKAFGELFNISDECPVTWIEFLRKLAEGLGCDLRATNLPAKFASVLAFAFEQGYRLLRTTSGFKSRALLSRQAVQIMSVDQDFSSRKIKTLLGFKPSRTFSQAMHETLVWAKMFTGI